MIINKILVPIDFSDYSKNALKYAADFALNFKAKIYLIYVIEPIIYPADFSIGQVTIPTPDVDMHSRAQTELDALAKTFIESSVDVETIIKSGKPFVEIVETATEKDVDLIIIATHGHTGVEHLIFGSTAARVIKKAPCPVLSLRDPVKGFQYNKR
jgi:nucleotide-binding universal stress UspA family protein